MSLNRQQRRALAREQLRAERKAARQAAQANTPASMQTPPAPPEITAAAQPPENVAPGAMPSTPRTADNPNGSTGPRTAAGKARSSQNAAKHLLSCTTFALLADEDEDEYHFLRNQLTKEYAPVGLREMLLVESIAQSFWLRQRAVRLLSQDGISCSQANTYLRYQATHDRAYLNFTKALDVMQKVRKEQEQDLPALKQRAFKAKLEWDEFRLAERKNKSANRSSSSPASAPPNQKAA